MTVYRVTGRVAYRSHGPGQTFEAVLDPAAEERAVRRQQIEIVERSTPSLVEGSYRLPRKAGA